MSIFDIEDRNHIKNNELISVIMPAYNTEKYVSEAVESVIKQTYTNWELLAIDDGSTDNTGNILDNYAKTDSRIKVFHQKNKGVSAARNVGLDNAKGTWVSFLDSDDLLLDNSFENLFINSDNTDVIIGSFEITGQQTKKCLNKDFYTQNKDCLAKQMDCDFDSFGTVWGKLFKKDCLVTRFRNDLFAGEDTVFLLQTLLEVSTIRTISTITYKYRKSRNLTLSNNYLLHSLENIIEVKELYKKLFNDEYLANTYFIYSIVRYLKLVSKNSQIGNKEKFLTEIIESKAFKEVELKQYNVDSNTMHLFSILKTGDIDLIEAALD